MSLKKKTIKGLGWDLSGRISGQAVSFVISVILARILSPKDFGILAMVNVVVAIANIFLDFGFNTSLVQKKEIKDEHYSSVFIFNLSIGLLLSILLYIFSGVVSRFYKNEIVEPVGHFMSLIFIFNSLGSIFRVKLYKELNFKALSVGGILGTVLSGAIGVFMAIKGFGVWSLVAQTLSSSLITSIYFFIKSRWLPRIIFNLKYLKELWGFSFSIFISTVVGVIFGQFDNLTIGKLFAPANLGYYYRAKSMESMMYEFTSQSLLTVLFPTLSVVKDDKIRFNSIICKSFHIISYFSVSLLGLLYLISKDLIVVLFTSKWLPSVDIFNLLLLSGFVYPINALFNSILASTGNSKSFLRLTILRYSILLPSYILLYIYNIHFFLIGFVILTMVSLLFSIKYVSQIIDFEAKWFLKALTPYILINFFIVIILNKTISPNFNNSFIQIAVFSTSFIVCNLLAFKFSHAEGLKLILIELKEIKNKLIKV
jgi:teichuronic acid exporter